jgi:large subunit ribosomal protein L17
LPKAKEVVPLAETLITKAKNGTLHDRRQILASVSTTAVAHKLVDEIAPQLTGRTSGHLRITRTRLRVGDNTQMAEVSFVDALTAPAAPVAEEKPAEKKAPAKAAKTEEAKK